VVVVTGRYTAPPSTSPPLPSQPRVGVRYLLGGLRVYHLPHLPMADQASLPTYFGLLPLLRAIFLRERATLAHGHAATSVLTHDFLICAQALGIPTLYTDHSLFGSADFASINVNKYLSLPLAGVGAAIAVSRASQANLSTRAALPLFRIAVIPNAVEGGAFAPPEVGAAPEGTLQQQQKQHRPPPRSPTTIVLLSRLVFRKGLDALLLLIPAACARWPEVRFVVGGDGPGRPALEAMVASHGLQGRVDILGRVPRADVPRVLARGGVFLNASLTEAFCMAILEAACAGCHVVASRVGGVPEVLPPHMVTLTGGEGACCYSSSSVEDRAGALFNALAIALPVAAATDPAARHREAAALYTWPAVARATEGVYTQVVAAGPLGMLEWYSALLGLGPVFGPVACVLVTLVRVMAGVLEWVAPGEGMDPALPAPRGRGEGGGGGRRGLGD
jgi:phosphatidylinositol glycan class A protein